MNTFWDNVIVFIIFKSQTSHYSIVWWQSRWASYFSLIVSVLSEASLRSGVAGFAAIYRQFFSAF